tara:strand:+ start:336 stop:707 length:372 start_codon:yes stop_codon:yes gene_type:complete
MKPTTEQILSALNKLIKESKTELKTEKIELGLVDDISKRINITVKEVTVSNKLISEKFALIKKLKNQRKEMLSLSSKLEKDLDRVEKAAKELGVDYTDIPEVGQAIKLLSRIGESVNELTLNN